MGGRGVRGRRRRVCRRFMVKVRKHGKGGGQVWGVEKSVEAP